MPRRAARVDPEDEIQPASPAASLIAGVGAIGLGDHNSTDSSKSSNDSKKSSDSKKSKVSKKSNSSGKFFRDSQF